MGVGDLDEFGTAAVRFRYAIGSIPAIGESFFDARMDGDGQGIGIDVGAEAGSIRRKANEMRNLGLCNVVLDAEKRCDKDQPWDCCSQHYWIPLNLVSISLHLRALVS